MPMDSRAERSTSSPSTRPFTSSFSRRKNSSAGPVTSWLRTISPVETDTSRASMRICGSMEAKAPVRMKPAPTPLPICWAVLGSMNSLLASSSSARISWIRSRSTTVRELTRVRSVMIMSARPLPSGSKRGSLLLLVKSVTATVKLAAAGEGTPTMPTSSSRAPRMTGTARRRRSRAGLIGSPVAPRTSGPRRQRAQKLGGTQRFSTGHRTARARVSSTDPSAEPTRPRVDPVRPHP